jgi:hypothetical protein
MRMQHLKILEIGVLHGHSLQTWEEYFPNATIIGADISPRSKMFEGGRIHIELLDQSNVEELTFLSLKYGPFDIIIEDGSHMWEHQTTSLRTLFPFLKNEGYYIVEDLQTNYSDLKSTYKGNASFTCVDFLKNWLNLRVGNEQIIIENIEGPFLRTYGRSARIITFYKHACLLQKSMKTFLRDSTQLINGNKFGDNVSVTLSAHLSYHGDAVGSSGFINFGSDRFTFQGLSIDSSEQILEYRVRDSENTWSNWFSQQTFAGSRGQVRELTGITVRLLNELTKHYSMRVVGRFAHGQSLIEVGSGQDCISNNGQPLCGLQIQIQRQNET